METKQIIFTKINTAELCDVPVYEPGDGQVLVKMAYTAISRGTERANITGDPNVSIFDGGSVHFPRALGYSGSGIVEKLGAGVHSVHVGDRVAVWNSQHRGYCTVHENQVIPIPYDDVPLTAAAFSYICTFPLAAVRKTRVELGEAAIVMGQGILGAMIGGVKNSAEKVLEEERLFSSDEELADTIIELGFASRAYTFIIPMQDVLKKGGDYRVNEPGTVKPQNWSVRFVKKYFSADSANKLYELTEKYKRL